MTRAWSVPVLAVRSTAPHDDDHDLVVLSPVRQPAVPQAATPMAARTAGSPCPVPVRKQGASDCPPPDTPRSPVSGGVAATETCPPALRRAETGRGRRPDRGGLDAVGQPAQQGRPAALLLRAALTIEWAIDVAKTAALIAIAALTVLSLALDRIDPDTTDAPTPPASLTETEGAEASTTPGE